MFLLLQPCAVFIELRPIYFYDFSNPVADILQLLFGLKTNFSRFFVIEIGHTNFATTGTFPSRSIVSWAKWFGGSPKDRADVKIFIPIVLVGLRTDFSLFFMIEIGQTDFFFQNDLTPCQLVSTEPFATMVPSRGIVSWAQWFVGPYWTTKGSGLHNPQPTNNRPVGL